MYKKGDLVESLLYPAGIYRPLIARVNRCIEEFTLECEIVWWDRDSIPTNVYLNIEFVIPHISEQLLL